MDVNDLKHLDYRDRIVQFKDVKGDREETADVLVIGTGAGGAAAAFEFANAGLKVIALEAGGYYPLRYINQNPLDMSRLLYWNQANVGPADGSIRISHGRCVGGSTLLHMLTMVPIPDFTLKRWREQGLSSFTQENLQPIVDEIKKIMNIKPIAWKQVNENARAFVRGCEKLGTLWRINERNGGACIGAGRCHLGCAFGGKVSMDVSFIPRALDAGLRLFSDCFVEKIATANGRAVGVDAVIRDRKTLKKVASLKVRAKTIVVAAGAMQTPALLLRSGLQQPQGLVGRRLHLQPGVNLIGEFPEQINGWQGITNPIHIDEWQPFEKGGFFCEPGLLNPSIMASGFPGFGESHRKIMERWKFMAGGEVLLNDMGLNDERGESHRVVINDKGAAEIQYLLADRDKPRFRFGLKKIAEVLFAGGATKVYVPHNIPTVLKSVRELQRFDELPLEPNDTVINSVHAQGSCPMGVTPESGVVDENGEMFHVRNLFIADASVFPDGIGTNTTVATATIGIRTARGILNRRDELL